MARLSVLSNDDERDGAWRRQLRDAVRTPEALAAALDLSDDERDGVRALMDQERALPLTITPHYLSLMDRADPQDPLRRQVVPVAAEFDPTDWDRPDPLGEEDHEVTPNLVHRYPDRVLLLATDRCASYCRFCTRKRMVGQGPTPTTSDLDAALEYIRARPQIREVILSGGDVLTMSDEKVERLLGRVRAIGHIDIIRIATRVPVFLPQRITPALCNIIAQHHPIYILTHFNHPNEIDAVAASAIERLVDAGAPVLNQTVLLRGVNDDVNTLETLCRRLTRLRARPYYLHQCDLAPGTAGFRVPIDEALELVGGLRGRVSVLCQPTFVVDVPGGLGKVPLFPSAIVDRDDDSVTLRGSLGEIAKYPVR